jgi:hypothetical protein
MEPRTWLLPYDQLSNGEQARATLARRLADYAIIDEFTRLVSCLVMTLLPFHCTWLAYDIHGSYSVVDRDTALRIAVNVSTFIRKRNFKCSLTQSFIWLIRSPYPYNI